MASTVAIPSAPPEAKPLSLGGLLVLAFGAADFGLESSIVLPALPVIAQEYSASLISVSWLATGFLLASVVAVPLFGRIGDLFGRRRMLLIALGAFGIGSLMCAVADSIELLIAGRIVQGAGAAVGPLALGIARDTLPREQLTRGIGILVGAAGAGAAIGYLVSGVLVDEVSVESLFWLLFAAAIVLAAGVVALVPAPPPRARASVDVGGAVLVASGLASLLLAISKGNDWGWDSGRVVVLFAGAAALLTAFLVVENRMRQPLIDPTFIAKRPFLQAHVCALAVGIAFAAVVIVVPQIAALPEVVGYGLGYSVTSIGLLLVPMALASIVAAWIAGRIVDLIGPRALMAIGAAAALAAYLLLIAAHDSAAPIATGAAGVGLAVGFCVTAIISVVARAAPLDKTSVAVAVHAVVRTSGIAIGTAATAAIITGAGLVGPLPAESGYTDAFVMGAIASGCALLTSALLPGRR
jgi:MFS family permease